MSTNGNGAFDRLARHFGIIGAYHDFNGNEIIASPETKRALLSRMGAEVLDESEANVLLAELDAQEQARRCAREYIVSSNLPFWLAQQKPCDWQLADEAGLIVRTGSVGGDGVMDLPALHSGIHQLELSWACGSETVTVIAAPRRAPSVSEMTGHERLWGMTAALYGLRSSRNTGIGDFADLGAAAEALSHCGAQFLGINPVHATGFADRQTISPYSPTSRSFYNIAHIAFDSIPVLAGSIRFRSFLEKNADKIETLRRAEFVDYEQIRPIRDLLIEELWEAFAATTYPVENKSDFGTFLSAGGENLRNFGLYEALSELHGPDSRNWPADLRNPDSSAVRSFAEENEQRIGFHCWLQWIADRQLAAAQEKAISAGMKIGLYLDVSVGSRPGGAESWANPLAVANGVSLGAPPDAFSPEGQNWNLSPYSPEGLRRARYKPFIDMLRSAMRHAGMVRIDHALGLSRSFWIPDTGEPGGYVRYPLDAMLSIIAIEAERNGTIVVGEDLGLVAPEFREKLQAAGLYGCAVMQFERHDGRFRDPREWREMSLGSFGTHDTPTFEGFRQARDIEWGARLSRGSRDNPENVRAERQAALESLFGTMGIEPRDEALPNDCDRMHASLANAGSALVAAQLDDVLGVVEQQNLPGTIDEHPNWRRRYEIDVNNLAGEESIRRLGQIMGRAGRSGSSD